MAAATNRKRPAAARRVRERSGRVWRVAPDGALRGGRCGRASGGMACPVIKSSVLKGGVRPSRFPDFRGGLACLRRGGSSLGVPNQLRRARLVVLVRLRYSGIATARRKAARAYRATASPGRMNGARHGMFVGKKRFTFRVAAVRPYARAVAVMRPSTSERGSDTPRFPQRSQTSLSTTRMRSAKRFRMPSTQLLRASADMVSRRRSRAAIRRS